MTGVITSVRTRLLPMSLPRPWGQDVTGITIIPVTIATDDGVVGTGFSWTPSIGAGAVRAMIDDELAPFLVGRSIDDWWQSAWEHLHEAGGGGVTTIALAGVDLAIWDLRGILAGRALTDLLGRSHESQPVYASGVNLHLPLDELVAQAQRWVAAGYSAVKMKVGKAELREDLDRVAAVREVIGAERELMVDANQRWTFRRAVEAAIALAPQGIRWLEEPLRSDDTRGYAQLHREIPIPIALGENVHTIHRFRDLIDARAMDVAQPNIVRVGGITPYLAIADELSDAGVTVAPHLLPELSAQVALASPLTTWVEDVEDAGFWHCGALIAPTGIEITQGMAGGGPSVGLGFRFTEEAED
jgi:L-alanine-DL-glutamate epimerase-like enolase superfamily enzyme